MEQDMGRVLAEATIENLEDLWKARAGNIQTDDIRRVTVLDALVDPGATTLSLPTRLIKQLGLKKVREKTGVSSKGATTINVYDAVRLTVQGRDCPVEVAEVPDEVPVLIGQIPLEYLDFVVDPQARCLIGNPAHGGEQILEMY
jgi:predicted aspartyl protease